MEATTPLVDKAVKVNSANVRRESRPNCVPLPFFSWELNLGNICPVPISLLFICVFYAKKSTFFFGLSKIPHIKVGNVFLFFCILTSTAAARVSWLIQWSQPFELKIKLDQILGLNRSAWLNGDIKLWTSRSQGLKVSRSQGSKVSRSQGPKVSRSQGPKVS